MNLIKKLHYPFRRHYSGRRQYLLAGRAVQVLRRGHSRPGQLEQRFECRVRSRWQSHILFLPQAADGQTALLSATVIFFFSVSIRVSSSAVGSSFGSCSTSFPHSQIQNESPQARYCTGRFTDLFKVLEQPIRVHRNSASSRMAFKRSRSLAVSVSLFSSLARSSAGSPWSSSTVWGFLKSRL